jgi:hypothetical protein
MLFAIAFTLTTYDFHSGKFSVTTIKSDLLSGVMASLIIALIYDLFTKKQEKVMGEIDRATLVGELSRRVFLTNGVAALSDSDINDLTAALVQDDRFLTAAARVTAVDVAFADNVLYSHLRPLWRGPVLRYYEWDNRLVPMETGDEPIMYTWKSHQRFSILSGLKVYRVAITDNAYIGAKLINSAVFFNNLVVMGGYNKSEIEGALHKQLFLGIEKRNEGRRVLHPMRAKIVQLENVFHDPDVSSQYEQFKDLVTVVEYELDEIDKEDIFEFNFSTQISYFEPFFYVEVENISFVESITVDYHEIAHRLEKVWVTSFIGNAGSEIVHDVREKVVKCQIDGIVMSGHAVLLTWLPATAEAGARAGIA